MGALPDKRTIGFKKEDVPYTVEASLAATDYDVAAYDINYDPEIEMMARKVARGDLSKDTSVAGKRSLTVTYSVDLHYSGAVATAPSYGKCLECCAFDETVHGGTGVSYITHANFTNVPATIEVVERFEGTTPVQVVIKGRGMVGNVRFVMDSIGKPIRMEFEFKGVLSSIADRAFGSILIPTGFDEDTYAAARPDAVLAATINLFTEAQQIDTMTIDIGNVVEVYTDPAENEGLEGGHVTTRNPTMEMDPDAETIADRGDYARWTGNTTGPALVTVGDNLQLSAPAVQYIKPYAPGDREGHVIWTKSMELKRSSGDDEFKLLQGSES